MSTKICNVLKFIAQIILPALATLYVTMASIWNWPFTEQISGTIMAIDTFLGAILAVSDHKQAKKEKQEKNEEQVT